MDIAAAGHFLNRSSGILLHVSSLPSKHGIGDLGPAAYEWIDQLVQSRQSWWQFLPLGPTGYADSPYQCFSAFAGNINFISLERLVEDGLLKRAELPAERFAVNEADTDRAGALKLTATAAAYRRFKDGAARELAQPFEAFAKESAEWLDPFALFVALKEKNNGIAWWDWPAAERLHDSQEEAALSRELKGPVELCKFRQFLFFHQWQQLRDYAHSRGIKLIGDMPIFIASDSADVWSRPELFQLDENRRPTFVAGVPPDYFSETGQLWGNPLYEWDEHRATNFDWWISRIRSTLELVDLVRLDHFRGFEAYWAVPAGQPTAEHGSWQPGPGAELFHVLKNALGSLPLIAEDLGLITPEVDALRQEFALPGMRVLQFAFGGAVEDRFIPHHYEHHTVVYTGTHDNETTVGWFENMDPQERSFLTRYAPGAERDPAWSLIRLAWASVADLAIAPLQDFLRLSNEARMNLPGRTEGNWRWRVDPAQVTPVLIDQLAELTAIYQREPKESVQSRAVDE